MDLLWNEGRIEGGVHVAKGGVRVVVPFFKVLLQGNSLSRYLPGYFMQLSNLGKDRMIPWAVFRDKPKSQARHMGNFSVNVFLKKKLV